MEIVFSVAKKSTKEKARFLTERRPPQGNKSVGRTRPPLRIFPMLPAPKFYDDLYLTEQP
jgi:hypothetical protein